MRSCETDNSPGRLLVIGYGSLLRADDSVGLLTAREIERLHLPAVRTIKCHQLTPELAADMANADEVIFADASADGISRPLLEAIEADKNCPLTSFSHFGGPLQLLALVHGIYRKQPKAWLLRLPAIQFGFGEELSAEAAAGVRNGVGLIIKRVRG